MPRFEQTSCSQCGQDFGPGNHGFSHCVNHRALEAACRVAAAAEARSRGYPIDEVMNATDRNWRRHRDELEPILNAWMKVQMEPETTTADSLSENHPNTARGMAYSKGVEDCARHLDLRGVASCERGMVDPSTGVFECRKLDTGECNCAEFDEVAESIRALKPTVAQGETP